MIGLIKPAVQFLPDPTQHARARAWNADRTGEDGPLFCCRCSEQIRASHSTVCGPGWAFHSKCCSKPPSYLEAPGWSPLFVSPAMEPTHD